MKIITITKEDKNKVSGRINLDFINLLSNYFDYKEIPVFNRKKNKILIKPEKIKKENPDIIICHTHNKLLNEYFKDFNCLKVMISVDLYKQQDFTFYKNNNFDIIIHRCYYENKNIPFQSIWLPFSANENEFFPLDFNKHKKRVAFAGSWKPKIYSQRQKAIKILENNNLIHNYGKVNQKDYPPILRENRIMLNSNELNSPYGKVFEIIKSGSLLLSPYFNGTKKLFLNEMYAEYKNDVSNISEIAEHYLKNEKETKEMIKNSYKIVEKYHTHQRRILELKNILINLYEGKKIEENW